MTPIELTAITEAVYPTVHLARTPRPVKLGAYEDLLRAFTDRSQALNEQVFNGAITVDAWETAMREQIKILHVQAYAAGRSGNWDDISFSEWGSIGNRLRRQYAFLRNFANDIRMGDMSLAKMNWRTGLYGSASHASFEAAIASEKGVASSALPAMPADGTTECMGNCRCRWAIRKRRGSHFCTWRLGRAEHCKTCVQRSTYWKDLEVRNGVLISSYLPIFYNP